LQHDAGRSRRRGNHLTCPNKPQGKRTSAQQIPPVLLKSEAIGDFLRELGTRLGDFQSPHLLVLYHLTRHCKIGTQFQLLRRLESEKLEVMFPKEK
jgi:hypothetical protein